MISSDNFTYKCQCGDLSSQHFLDKNNLPVEHIDNKIYVKLWKYI